MAAKTQREAEASGPARARPDAALVEIEANGPHGLASEDSASELAHDRRLGGAKGDPRTTLTHAPASRS
jgi:hypothetical protein